jgi:hypothetical protein
MAKKKTSRQVKVIAVAFAGGRPTWEKLDAATKASYMEGAKRARKQLAKRTRRVKRKATKVAKTAE